MIYYISNVFAMGVVNMSPARPSGRQKTTGSGGGNVYKRGSGLGTGPVGGGGRPSSGGFSGGSSSGGGSSGGRSGGGTRSTGGSLLAVLAALLIGKAASSGGSGNSGNTSRSGCLKRIIIIAVIVVAVLFLVRMCRGGGTVADLLNGDAGGSLLSDTQDETDDTVDSGAQSTDHDLSSLLGGSNSVYTGASAASAYQAHEPDYTVDASARTRYTQLKGNGADTATVMVFMCGADLESSNGMGTADLLEMIKATISDNVNLIVETGGASSWKNDTVSSRTNQRYQVKTGGLKRLEANLGKKSMVDPDTLSDFIRYCKSSFPADRYALILWDHGGGSITGYGYDELFSSDGSMTLDEINEALKDGGCQFDFIGFDACLMATLETALVAEQYADYLIASEATEPGTGWYYTNWLTTLSKNTSISTVELAKVIIDDFVSVSAQSSESSPATLSLTDLAELDGTVPEKLTAFSKATSALLESDFATVSKARSNAKDFSSSTRINQIDLIHFADNLNTESSNALAGALRGCIKYNRSGKSVTNANGVTIYFPYQSLSKVSTALSTYKLIGMDESYISCVKSFASMAAGGQVTSNSSADALGSLLGGDSAGSLLGSLLGASQSDSTSASYGSTDAMSALLEAFLGGDRSIVTGDRDSSWVDAELLRDSVDYYAAARAGFDALTLSEVNGHTVLSMTEEQWAMVQTLEMNVFVDDGGGYIDLGLDFLTEYDGDGNLIMEYDGTWLALNGQIVPCYYISEDRTDDGSYTMLYRVPAMLHGSRSYAPETLGGEVSGEAGGAVTIDQRVNIILAFTDENPYGVVLGAQTDYEETSDAVVKGLLALEAGDTVDLICDYYGYDGVYSDSYLFGDTIPVTGEWVVENLSIGDLPWSMCYRLTDIYAGRYWTPVVSG